jgi:chromosome segregation ATPase
MMGRRVNLMEAKVAKLEARVDRNEADISKLIDSLTATREAATELTANLKSVDESIRDYSKTLYGNGDRRNSLVTIADTLVLECKEVHIELQKTRKIAEDAMVAANKAVIAADKAVEAADKAVIAAAEYAKLRDGSVIQWGKLKISGKSANVIAMLFVPMGIIAGIMSVIYFTMAIAGKVPWPW